MTRWAKRAGTILWLWAALLLLGPDATAQTRTVEIVNADAVEVTSDSLTGTVRRLTGNVVLRQDTTQLRANRAVQYVERGEIVLDGAVRITAGDDTLTARRVTYDSNVERAQATGDVRIADGLSVLLAPSAQYDRRARQALFTEGGRLLSEGATLTAPSGRYDTQRKLADLDGPVRLEDSTAVLTAERGQYDARAERADFAGTVRLVRQGLRLWADSLVHVRPTDHSEAHGQVVLQRLGDYDEAADGGTAPDSTRRTLLFGAYGEHDGRADSSLVTGTATSDPLLVQLRTDSTGTDTTLVRARRFVALRFGVDRLRFSAPVLDSIAADSIAADSTTTDSLTVGPPARSDAPGYPEWLGESPEGTVTRVLALGDVRLVQPRLAAAADSSVFERFQPADSLETVRDRLALFAPDRASVWVDEAQLTGDTLQAFALAEALDRLDVHGNAFAAQLDSTLGRVRQIAGRQMRARFERDSLRTLSVWPEAEAIYFRATPEGLLDGADRLSADSLVFRFRNGRLAELFGARSIEGTAYGPTIIPQPFQLDGYRYTPEAQPLRARLLPPASWEALWLEGGETSLQEAPESPPSTPEVSGG